MSLASCSRSWSPRETYDRAGVRAAWSSDGAPTARRSPSSARRSRARCSPGPPPERGRRRAARPRATARGAPGWWHQQSLVLIAGHSYRRSNRRSLSSAIDDHAVACGGTPGATAGIDRPRRLRGRPMGRRATRPRARPPGPAPSLDLHSPRRRPQNIPNGPADVDVGPSTRTTPASVSIQTRLARFFRGGSERGELSHC